MDIWSFCNHWCQGQCLGYEEMSPHISRWLNNSSLTVIHYRKLIDELTIKGVRWTPYETSYILWTLFAIWFNAYLETNPRSLLYNYTLKVWPTTWMLCSKEALISLCHIIIMLFSIPTFTQVSHASMEQPLQRTMGRLNPTKQVCNKCPNRMNIVYKPWLIS